MGKGETVVAAYDPTSARGRISGFSAGRHRRLRSSLQDVPPHVYSAPEKMSRLPTGGRWFLVNGSSFSAAHVSGLIALVRQGGSDISPTLVAQGGYIDACATMAYDGAQL